MPPKRSLNELWQHGLGWGAPTVTIEAADQGHVWMLPTGMVCFCLHAVIGACVRVYLSVCVCAHSSGAVTVHTPPEVRQGGWSLQLAYLSCIIVHAVGATCMPSLWSDSAACQAA